MDKCNHRTKMLEVQQLIKNLKWEEKLGSSTIKFREKPALYKRFFDELLKDDLVVPLSFHTQVCLLNYFLEQTDLSESLKRETVIAYIKYSQVKDKKS